MALTDQPNITSTAELSRWLGALRPSEMIGLLADLAIREPDTFEASRRRVVGADAATGFDRPHASAAAADGE